VYYEYKRVDKSVALNSNNRMADTIYSTQFIEYRAISDRVY